MLPAADIPIDARLSVSTPGVTDFPRDDFLRLAQFAVDNAADGILWVEPSGRVIYANQAAERLLGYSREELRSLHVYDFDASFDAATWPDHWQALRRAGAQRLESQARTKSGALIPVAVTINHASLAEKEFGFAFIRDITAGKKAEAELAEQKHLFDILMENVPDHIYFKDRESRFIRISKSQASYFGIPDPSAAVGKTDSHFFSETYANQSYQDEQEILRTGKPMLGSVEKGTLSDGQESWVATAKMPLSDRRGKIIGTFGLSRNITRSKRAEAALRASEEFTKRILESSTDGVCVLDLDGAVHYVSAGGRKLLALNETGDLPPLKWLNLWAGHDRQRTEKALQDATAGAVGSYQGTLRTGKAAATLFDIVISPITDAHGKVERLVCVFRDITERRLLENQLAQAQKLESIGQLAAGIAHEINTPIQYIGDNGKFLEEAFQDLIKAVHAQPDVDLDYLRAEIPKAIEQLLEGVQHVARIVGAMKEFSHPGPLEKTPVDINHAIDSTILVCRNEWKYIAEVTTDFDRALPKVSCLAGEINQVILNLIVNAAHAISEVVDGSGKKGLINISTRRNANWVEIRVRDTGPGIPEAIRSKVFDPFFTTKPVGKGTGQGLAIAHAVIVRKHNGTISFESDAGCGTTFLIQLPLNAA